jgi:TonB-linked SusC/RagA family outer membrane protein
MKRPIQIVVMSLLMIVLGIKNGYGQHVVRGSVTDKETGETIVSATIAEMDENDRIVKGTITDIDGNYVLDVSDTGHRLQFSFIGYETQIEEIGNRTLINIELEPSTIGIEEVVIRGTGQTDVLTGQSVRDRTTATARVDMEDMQNVSNLSVDEALQGQVSGLDIMSGGAPGGGSSIVIRGLGSLANSRPLIVVNGIPQDINISSDFDFAGSDQQDIGQLLNIAPQDIKSIEVLKDAASTAVWGSRGADGVLLIETRRGTKGKTKFNYNYRATLTQQPPPIPMLNGDEYITLQLEQLQNANGLFTVPDELAYNPEYVDFYNYSANTDWIGEITRPGFNHDHYFKFSGGGDKTLFFASLNAVRQDGTTLNEAFKRLSTRINLDYNLSRNVRFSVNFDYTNSYRNGNYYNIRRMAYIKAPNMSIREHDENGNLTGEYFNPINSYQGSGTQYFNPVAIANLSKNDVLNNTFQNSFIINYRITDWLRFVETLSFQYSNVKNMGFLPYTAIGADWLDNRKNESRERNTNNSRIASRNQLIFTPVSTAVHTLSGSLMAEVSRRVSENSDVRTGNGPSVSLTDPSVGAPIKSISSNFADSRSFGVLGSLNYKYMDKYLVSVIARADASSSFGENNRWGIFPSFSVGWRFSNESWFSSWDFISNGMLRAGYGQAGREPSNPYDRFGLFVNANPNLYIENPAIVPSKIDLTNLKWQMLEAYNLGLELSFLNERLYLSADLYDKITNDILWRNYSIPSSSGFPRLAWFNGGKIRNYGWEASMRYNIVRRKDLSLIVNFNIARNINSFLEFPDNFNNLVGTSIGNGVYPRMAQVGQPVGSFYGFRYLGVYSTSEEAYSRNKEGENRLDANGDPIPMTYTNGYRFRGGDAIYEDINHDGVIDLADVVYLGDSNPKYSGGFGFNARYKQFSLSSQFLYRVGFDIVNEIALTTEGMLDRNNQSKAVLYRWRNEGDNYPGMIPRAYMNHPANNLGSDRYVEKGDFIRLNNITASYRLNNPSMLPGNLVDELELGINLRKLWTLTNYSGQDPEIPQSMQDPFWFGRDNGQTPSPRVYSVFLNVRF